MGFILLLILFFKFGWRDVTSEEFEEERRFIETHTFVKQCDGHSVVAIVPGNRYKGKKNEPEYMFFPNVEEAEEQRQFFINDMMIRFVKARRFRFW